MSNCQIQFQYIQEKAVIQCQRKEIMRDIIGRYVTGSGLSIKNLNFLYKGNKINMDSTLAQVNNEDKEILIMVSPNGINRNENEKENSDLTKFIQYSNKTIKNSENTNEIIIKIKIEQSDIDKDIYFLDNTSNRTHPKGYYENGKDIKHNHNNLNDLNENNTTLIIDGKTLPFKKSFIPIKTGTYSIKLLFKNKLSNCAYMFCECKNIIDIDFSKFKSENVTDMQRMFDLCSGLKSLNLTSFNTQNVTDMYYMFAGCSSLTTLNLSSFNTKNVTDMKYMFSGCSSLTSLNLSSFDTQNVNNMVSMFDGCSSLLTLNLSSFNTQNVTDMGDMFDGCFSLLTLDLSLFNTKKVINMAGMFQECFSLKTLNLSSFNTQNVMTMIRMFERCYSLTTLNLSSFNAAMAETHNMFSKCINLYSCGSSDKDIVNTFKNKE